MAEIGIMGGTFDPIHNGHLLLAKRACDEYKLDEIWFMPAGQPPHKKDHLVTDVEKRCEMVKLAISGHSQFVFSDFEVTRSGNTYTADTMELLRKEYPEHRFFFIIGADSLYEIEKWYCPERILGLCTLLVAGREYEKAKCSLEEQINHLIRRYKATIFCLHGSEVDISSADLRVMKNHGKSLVKYVPKEVEQYIEAHGLYLKPDLEGKET